MNDCRTNERVLRGCRTMAAGYHNSIAVLLATVFCLGANVRAGVTITSPTPGDTLVAGQVVQISWTKTADVSDTGTILVTLRRVNEGPGFRILFSTSLGPPLFVAGDGAATFRVPDWAGDESDYTLTLSVAGSIPGENFIDTVSPVGIVGSANGQRLELPRPVSPSRWRVGHRQRVDFIATGFYGAVAVSLANLDIQWTLSVTSRASDGYALLDLPADMPGGDYMIRVSTTSTPERQFRKMMPFDEVPAPTIEGLNPDYAWEITVPDPGQVWNAGEARDVCWTTSLTNGDVIVTVARLADFSGSATTARARVGDGCVSLTPCSFVEGSDFIIFVSVRPEGGGSVMRWAPGLYTVSPTSSAPVLNLTSLNNAPTFTTGDTVSFTWEHAGFPADAGVIPFLHADDSEHLWLTNIGFSEPIESGVFNWTAFAPVTGTTEYIPRICVPSVGCPLVCDVADAPITILPLPNPPLFDVSFDGQAAVYRADEEISVAYTALGVTGMEVELRILQDDRWPWFVARQPAIDGPGVVFGTPQPAQPASRLNRFEVRLLNGDAVLAKALSDPFVFVSGVPTCGDVADDLIVDHRDWFELASCMGLSPLAPPGGPPFVEACRSADFNGDERIDLHDHQIFQNHFGIGSSAEPPNCPVVP